MSYRIVEDSELAKRNQTFLTGCGSGVAYNAVLKVELSDEQAALDGDGSNLHFLNYTATGGESSFQDDLLIGVLVYEVSKDGIEFTKVTAFSDPTKKQYIHNSATGEITFPIPMEAGEDSIVKYIGQNSAITGGEPVSLAEAKEWLKISPDISEDDTLIQMLITASRIICEKAANLSFIPRTVTATILNRLGHINLPYGPVTGTPTYTEDDDDLTAITDFNIRTGYEDRVIATYTAGYSVLPKNLKTALLNQIAWSYENRGDVAMMTNLSPLSFLVLSQIRVET